MNIRQAVKEDKEALHHLLQSEGIFTLAEVKVAMELVDDSLKGSPEYLLAIASLPDLSVAGYICYGLNPVTDAFYDLYWLMVAPQARRKGIGKALIESMEESIRQMGGRGICIETSSREEYLPARRLYESCHYSPAATLHDFYKPGDHQIIYIKYLNPVG